MAEQKYGTQALNAEVAKDYELVDWTGGHRQDFGKYSSWLQGGVLDLSTLTLDQAARLVEMKFPKLRKRESMRAVAPAAAPAKESKD
jgi:hypothetical protein